ncbi:hypothetical protein MKW92_027735 [Papaver armeniacum]|nr:hypothetical protein MKW92_027735 [Papaver armeniacum]
MAFFHNNTQVASLHLLSVHLCFFFILLISISQYPLASHCCHDEDRSALLNFKSSLNDPSNRLSSWKHQNCCDWHGIRCSNDSFRVVSIDLRNTPLEDYIKETEQPAAFVDPPSTSLTGRFSASILKLTHLQYLDLAYNNFQESQISRQFSNLTTLTHLDLSFSNFSKSLSTQFSNLSFLQHLDLSCIGSSYATSCLQISSSKWARGLVKLKVLRLSGIELNSWYPLHLANLTSLSILDLSGCNLYGSSGSVPYLPQLKELDVSYNQDLHVDLYKMFEHEWPNLNKLWISQTLVNKSIPSSISNAPLLVSLSASSCSIHGSLPSSFYNLSQLQYLDLSYNSITGDIHSSISKLKFLYHLDLSNNRFQGSIPKSICEIFSLQKLQVSYNNITGILPSCMSNLKNLGYFGAAQNFIEGNVSLFSLIGENLIELDMRFNSQLNLDMRWLHLDQPKLSLKSLRLFSCNLKGSFPISLCNFTDLVFLGLSENSFTGTIPSCLFKLKYLRKIYLSGNKLEGSVPLPPQGTERFDLSKNKFSGEISLEFGKRLSDAYSIILAGNELSGSIPFTLCPTEPGAGFTSIQVIDLSNNKLSGTIPSNLGYCESLTRLQLGNNNLTGKVPDELKLLKQIKFLQLNNNLLHGTPLSVISEFERLEFLNLANNSFEGSIPAALGSLEDIRFLSLRSNKFNGSIPQEIIHLQKLQLLDLSLNNFTGHIPKKLANLSGMIITSYLLPEDLGDVQLYLATKGIMIQIQKLNNYSSSIDLSCNHLHGDIPKEIGSLTLLNSLNLSNNHFSDGIPESIGNLTGLQSLDLSSNNLSGHIPQSLAVIDTLAVLNLSSNKLSGKIPRSPHFDTLSVEGYAFSGNELLCGYPTKNPCDRSNANTGDANPSNEFDEVDGEDAKEKLLFYAIIALDKNGGFHIGKLLILLL